VVAGAGRDLGLAIARALADLRRSGVRGLRVSAVCPDGIWTPMLHDELDDPAAAPSFSGVLLRPETRRAKVAGLLDRPRGGP